MLSNFSRRLCHTNSSWSGTYNTRNKPSRIY